MERLRLVDPPRQGLVFPTVGLEQIGTVNFCSMLKTKKKKRQAIVEFVDLSRDLAARGCVLIS